MARLFLQPSPPRRRSSAGLLRLTKASGRSAKGTTAIRWRANPGPGLALPSASACCRGAGRGAAGRPRAGGAPVVQATTRSVSG